MHSPWHVECHALDLLLGRHQTQCEAFAADGVDQLAVLVQRQVTRPQGVLGLGAATKMELGVVGLGDVLGEVSSVLDLDGANRRTARRRRGGGWSGGRGSHDWQFTQVFIFYLICT